MLIYKKRNPNFQEYDARYESNKNIFGETAPDNIEFIGRLVATLAAREQCNILDLGCGQGWFTGEVASRFSDAPAITDLRVIGVDGSSTAIDQAAQREPGIDWVADTITNFLNEHDRCLPGLRYDLVIDRGGTTIIPLESEGFEIARRCADLMKETGIFSYIVSKSWYFGSGTVKPAHVNWSKDWISLLKEQFGSFTDYSTDAYFQFAFSKNL